MDKLTNFNQIKKFLFKRCKNENQVLRDDSNNIQYNQEYERKNFTKMSDLFFLSIQIISSIFFVSKLIVFIILQLNGNMFIISLIETIFFILLTSFYFINSSISKRKINKGVMMIINICIIYASLSILILLLTYQNNLSIESASSLIYFLILLNSTILLLVNKWTTFLFIFNFFTNTLVNLMVCLKFGNFYGMIPLSIFNIIFICIIIKIKFIQINLIKKNCRKNILGTELFEKYLSILDFKKISYFIFHNKDLIFINKNANNLINVNDENSFNHKNLKDSNILSKHTQKLLEDSLMNILNVSSNDLKPNTKSIKNKLKIFFSNIFPRENQSNLIGHAAFDNFLSSNPINQKEKNLYEALKIFSTLNIQEEKDLGIFELITEEKKIFFNIVLKVDREISNDDKITEIFITEITQKVNNEISVSNINRLNSILEHKEKHFKNQAHEFKTPLNSIIGCCMQLRNVFKIIKDKKVLSLINQINNVSEYVQFLIQDMISIDNKYELKLKKLNINEILTFSYEILNSLLLCDEKKRKNIKPILINKLTDYHYINADEIRVKQILLNFISNAVKFTNQGKIKLKTKNCEKNNQYIKLEVADTGLGIKDNDKEKLFKEYSKLTNVNNEFGTGLGLNITHNLALRMNMIIKVKSIEKVGTKMILYIPIYGENLTPRNIKTSSLNVTISKITNSEDNYFRFKTINQNRTNKLNRSLETNITFRNRSNNRSRSNKIKDNLKIRNNNFGEENLKQTLINCQLPPSVYEHPLLQNFSIDSENILSHKYSSKHNLNKLYSKKSNINLGYLNSNLMVSYVSNSNNNIKEKIIVVDDQLFQRVFLVNNIKSILSDTQNAKYEVLEGVDGIDSLKYILDHQSLVKIIFTDLNMTFMKGSESAMIIRNMMHHFNRRPIIVLTSSDDEDNNSELYDKILQKPVDKNNLKEFLLSVLD